MIQQKRTIQALSGLILGIGLGWSSPVQAQPSLSDSLNRTLSPSFSPDPVELRGLSGGGTAADDVADRKETANGPCVGFVDSRPNHTLELTAFFDYLSVQVQSPEDTTLVVRGPGGTWCNDDSKGKNPGIAGQWLPGTYRIWIGTFKKNSDSPYILRITKKR